MRMISDPVFYAVLGLSSFTAIVYSVRFLKNVPSVEKLKSTPVNSDLRSIRMYETPILPSNIIRLIRISHYSHYFIRSLEIRIRRIQV